MGLISLGFASIDKVASQQSDFFNLIQRIDVLMSIIGGLIIVAFTIIKFRRKRNRDKSLSDFLQPEEVKEYLENYITTQGVDRPPEDKDEPKDSHELAFRGSLVKYFFDKVFTKTNSKTIFIVMAGAGMGKTTFLINLFNKYNKKVFRNYRMRYVPLGDPMADERIASYKKDGSELNDGSNTILLLDAFDEDTKMLANYRERLSELIGKVRTYGKVIITCRTQFFPEEEESRFNLPIPNVAKSGGIREIHKKYISPFTEEEIDKYLKKRYGYKLQLFNKTYYQNPSRKVAEEIEKKASSLVVRPMLLDNIDLLVGRKKGYNNEYEIYEALIDSWLLRESRKQVDKTNTDFYNEMFLFTLEAAKNAYENFIKNKGLFIDYALITKIATDKNIKLSVLDLSTRSLLNRSTKGRLKFSHLSIFEFFLARLSLEQSSSEFHVEFSHFQFGAMMRNMMSFSALYSDVKQILAIKSHSKGSAIYFPLKKEESKNLTLASTLIVSNYFKSDLVNLLVFKNLKQIYVLPDLNIDNIKSIRAKETSITDKKIPKGFIFDFNIKHVDYESVKEFNFRGVKSRFKHSQEFTNRGVNLFNIKIIKK